jgi:Fic family protein
LGDHEALLCPLENKAEIEAANGVAQIDYLTDLVTGYKAVEVRESHILQLQQLAVEAIYPCGGRYRDARSNVYISDSSHKPPEAALIPGLVRELLDRINDKKASALDRAAYALWRLNWIHRFRGGNGRTSRCIAYAILCMDVGSMIPGVPSLPTLIYEKRDEYLVALRAVDQTLRDSIARMTDDGPAPEPDLNAMATYLRELVLQQMANAVDQLSTSRPA